MGILRSLKNLFTGAPYEVKVSLGNGAVLLLVRRGNSLVTHADLISEKSLPEPLKKFLKRQTPVEGNSYRISYLVALQLIQDLAPQISDNFKVDAENVVNLKIIPCPNDFQVHWQYHELQQQLIKRTKLAEGYLGSGWFYKGQTVWKIPELSENLMIWLDKPIITGKELMPFCVNIFPKLDQTRYLCEIDLDQDFDAKLNIVKILKHSIDVQIITNKPDIASHLKIIADDNTNLISGKTLISGWRSRLSGKLLELTRSGEVQRIQGEDLLAFIQDDIVPNASGLSADIDTLQATFRILDAAQCPTRWKLEHTHQHRVGSYHAVPCLSVDAQLIPLEQMGRKIEGGSRFYRLETGWLEFTPEFKSRYLSWKQKGISPIRLLPPEVLGTHLERLNKLKIHPPVIKVEQVSIERDQARKLIEVMRWHGLPCGFSGLQQDASAILAEVCREMLRDDNQAQILWLVPRRKLGDAATSLKNNRVPHSRELSRQRGQVSILSPDNQIPDLQWNLIIFTDIDMTATGERQSRLYSALRRSWSISTFSREDWHRDRTRSQRVLSAIGLHTEDLAAYIQICIGHFTQQPDSLLARLTSPFKSMFIGTDNEGESGKGVPIPPRREQSAPTPLKNTDNVYRPSFTASVNVSTPKNRFLEQAQQLANHIEPQTESVPFMQYWPTYESMTQAQKKWYFYWRSQVRRKNYLSADLSYMFVHIYEIIHLIGFNSAQIAYDYLVAFWENYRLLHPKLDNYLVDWIADFIVIHKLPQDALVWYAYATTIAGRLTDENLALEAWLLTSSQISDIPEGLLNAICDYRYTKSKFYQQHSSQKLIDTELRRGLSTIDSYVQQQYGKSLFEYYRPTQTREVRRQPFASAVYEGQRQTITIASVPDWATVADLRTTIASILKYSENRLRRQSNFRGTLRGIELPQEWVDVLDIAFPLEGYAQSSQADRQEKPLVSRENIEPLAIDFERVRSLAEESDTVRDRLIIDENTAIVETASESIANKDTKQVADNQLEGLNMNRPEDTPDHLLTELVEVGEILSGDTTGVTLLRYLLSASWEANEEDVQSILDGEFLTVVLDRLNERAIELLGDQLIFVEDAKLIVTEDFQDEIEHLLSNPDEMENLTDKAEITEYRDLEPAWAEFVTKMRSHHWEALNALLIGEDIVARLDGIARSAFTTSNLLLDEINESALSSIGDIVIDVGDIPFIEDEDIESLRSLVTWATQNRNLEF